MTPVPAKIGAVSAFAGAMALLIGTSLHPMGSDPGNAPEAFAEYAADSWWVFTHLGQFAGIFLMVVGLMALSDVLRGQRSGWLARLGLMTAYAALVAAAALQAVDGIALKHAVDRWQTVPASQKDLAFEAAFAVRQVEIGLASLVAILFGLALLLFGSALARGEAFPHWIGWLGGLSGLGTLVGGIMTASAGFSPTAMSFAMPFNLAAVLWTLLIGILLWRHQ